MRKPSFFFLNLTDWHDGSPQCCCHTITRSRLKLLYIHWRCLPCFIHHEILMNFVGRKQSCFFTKYLSLFCMFNLSQVVLDWRPTRRRLYSIFYVGELALASWTVGDLTVIHIYLVYIVILFLEQIRGNWNPNCNPC